MKKKLSVQTRNQLWKLETEKRSNKRSDAMKRSKEKTLSSFDKSISKINSIINELKKRFKK